jgi:hypothetical protein
MRFPCLIGIHQWDETLSTELIAGVHYSAKRCHHCAKIKEHLWDEEDRQYLRLPRTGEEMCEFEPVWKKILARAK